MCRRPGPAREDPPVHRGLSAAVLPTGALIADCGMRNADFPYERRTAEQTVKGFGPILPEAKKQGNKPNVEGFPAVEHEPSAHPKKRKAEDENEDEDDGCRLTPTTYYLLLRAEEERNVGQCTILPQAQNQGNPQSAFRDPQSAIVTNRLPVSALEARLADSAGGPCATGAFRRALAGWSSRPPPGQVSAAAAPASQGGGASTRTKARQSA